MSSAGTGKTTRLIADVNRLIDGGTDPSRILVITFSVAGKDELVSRMTNKIVTVRTMHSLFLWLMNQSETTKVGEIIRELDRIRMLDDIVRKSPNRRAIEGKNSPSSRDILQAISLAKNYCIRPLGCYNSFLFDKKSKLFAIDNVRLGKLYKPIRDKLPENFLPYFDALYTQYEITKGAQIDFDDILLLCRDKMFTNQYGIRDRARSLYDHVFIDEFQDTNQIQFDIIREMISESCHLTVIGDWKQNIYEWRGADYKLLKNIDKYYPEVEIEHLDKTYRNGKKILNIANGVACKILGDRPISTAKDFDGEVVMAEFGDGEAELQYVLSRLPSATDTFVLARNNAQLQELELSIQLLLPDLDYSISGTPFCGSEMVLDLTATLAALYCPERLPERGWGRVLSVIARYVPMTERRKYISTKNTQNATLYKAIKNLEEYQQEARNQPVTFMDLLGCFIKSVRYADSATRNKTKEEKEDTLDAIDMFIHFGKRFPSMFELLKFCARNAVSTKNPNAPVKLMTVHASKGMQAKEVILYGLSEGKFPSKKSTISQSDAEGEERLLYVAVSRAIERLIVTCGKPSIFFRELERFNLTNNVGGIK